MKDLATMGAHAAEVFLERRGFGIIECPYKDADSDGPIDIIAEDEGSMVFVAVKCRKDGDSLPTYEPDREELESFACRWFREHADDYSDMPFRFDFISILVIAEDRAIIKHYVNAMALDAALEED